MSVHNGGASRDRAWPGGVCSQSLLNRLWITRTHYGPIAIDSESPCVQVVPHEETQDGFSNTLEFCVKSFSLTMWAIFFQVPMGPTPSEKDAKLAQKLDQLQPFIDVIPQECVGQLAYFGQTEHLFLRHRRGPKARLWASGDAERPSCPKQPSGRRPHR